MAEAGRRRWPWPRTLYGQIVTILVCGLLAAQLFTGSIWFELRSNQALEIPLRLAASRTVDALRLLAHDDSGDALAHLDLLRSSQFSATLRNTPTPATGAPDRAIAAREELLRQMLTQKLGQPVAVRLLRADLDDAGGRPAGWWALFDDGATVGHFQFELPLPDGRWLHVTATDAQGWTRRAPWAVFTDYVLRIYLLRVLVVALLALLALRLAIDPLKQLARAAEALGENIRREPLPVRGPAEVRQASLAFNRMQQRLIASQAQRERFMAAVSHDLRTPITRLRLRTELLDDEALRARFRHDLDDMEALVTATLDSVAVGETREPMQPIDVPTLLQGLREDFLALGTDIALRGRVGTPLPGYARSLRRALQNLVENAVRYGRDVAISAEDGPDLLQLRVLDRGPGIPDEQLERALEPFHRLEPSRNSGTGGYGLGLSIAQTVAQAHGGALRLRNRDGGGLEACLSLPRRRSA